MIAYNACTRNDDLNILVGVNSGEYNERISGS